MLNYGAAAQNFFYRDANKKPIYTADQLANADLTEEMISKYASTSEVLMDDQDKGPGGYKSSSLVMESILSMNFVFEKKVVTQDMYAIVTYTNHVGEEREQRVEGKDFTSYNTNYWKVLSTGFVVADGDQKVTCRIYNADGTEVTYAVDTMNSYLSRAVKGSTEPLYKMALRFTQSAYAYLHRNG
jgi:hypothetical protein